VKSLARAIRSPRFLGLFACIAIASILAAPTVVFCPRGLASCELAINRLGSTGDSRFFAGAWEATRVALVDFHQFPSWNPFHCGGVVLYQDAQTPFPGLPFLLTFFWLPTAVAIKVWIFTHLLCGALGARALAADRGANLAEQIVCATLAAASGFVAEHIGGGHLSFTPFLFFPLILWSFRRALVDVRYIVLTAALFALTAIQGGVYPVPMMAVALLVESIARLGSATDRRRLSVALPIFAGLFVLLAGVRLVPVMMYLREHPRFVPLDDHITLGEVFRFWTTRTHSRAMIGHPYVWPEYDAYVGVVPVALMLVGLAITLLSRTDPQDIRRARRIDAIVFVGLVWCALGNVAGPSLFGLLHKLPIYASLRVPSRFLGPATAVLGLLAVTALMWTRSWLARRGTGPRLQRAVLVAQAVLVVGVVLDVTLTNQRVMQQGIDPVLSGTRAGDAFFQNTGVDYTQYPTFPVRGFGTRACYTALDWKPARGIVDGRVPQAWVRPGDAGTVSQTSWTPNRVELDVHFENDGLLIVNQNYETGWRSNIGTVGAYLIARDQFWDRQTRPPDLPPSIATGLLAVRLPQGDHHVSLRHRPHGLALGMIMTLLGMGIAVAILKYATPERVANVHRLWVERMRTLIRKKRPSVPASDGPRTA